MLTVIRRLVLTIVSFSTSGFRRRWWFINRCRDMMATVVHLPQAEHHILCDVLCLVPARSAAHAHAERLLPPRAGLLFKCRFIHLFLALYTY